jgi:hypothetical protein
MDLVFNTFAFEAYSSRKSCTMTSQDSWMFRKLRRRYWVSRVPSTQSPLSSTDLLLKSHKNCVTSTGSTTSTYVWSLARRDGWQRPFWPLALAVVTMIVMGYIAEATDNKYVSPLLCSHIFTFCTKSEVSKAVRRKG